MENHHHCSICGDMVSPERTICFNCVSKAAAFLPESKRKTIWNENTLQDAIDAWLKLDKKKEDEKT